MEERDAARRFRLADGFDDLMVYRLKMGLEDSISNLEMWIKKDTPWTEAMWSEYSDTLDYCRSLLIVLDWHTVEDYTEQFEQLSKYTGQHEGIF